MNHDYKLTVKDVLRRETFKYAKLLAGEGGLNRQVKWAHILETKEFESLLNGGELILTTGVGLELDSPNSYTYEKLIQHQAACLCIEKGPYFQTISPKIKQFADQHHFPIIVFEKVVKFVDITLDLHTLIINQHYKMLKQLNDIAKHFTDLSLTHNGTLKILQRLSNYFQKSALFITDNDQSYYYPPESKHFEQFIRSSYHEFKKMSKMKVLSFDHDHVAIFPVIGLGQIWGHVFLEIDNDDKNEFIFSVLDRAASAIAQILLRNRTLEERKLNQEDEIVQNLIQGKEYKRDELASFFPLPKEFSESMVYRTMVVQSNFSNIAATNNEWEELKLQLSMSIRGQFVQHRFYPIISVRKHQIVIICFLLLNEPAKKNKSTFFDIAQEIINILAKKLDLTDCYIGISGLFHKMSQIPKSFSDAKKTIKLQESKITHSFFYENIGIHHLFFQLSNIEALEAFIEQYIGPLIQYDRETGSELLITLSKYLECLGSKKEASEQLFIVRQTLYHRLEKIQQLLDLDLLEPNNRLAIETAIKAYSFLNNISS